MNTLLDEINRWWPLLSIAATLACGWCLWQLSRRFVSREEHEAILEAQDTLESRVEKLERRMETVPDNETMHKIALSLSELRGDMKEMRGRMDGMETSMLGLKNEISMLIEHHLESGR